MPDDSQNAINSRLPLLAPLLADGEALVLRRVDGALVGYLETQSGQRLPLGRHSDEEGQGAEDEGAADVSRFGSDPFDDDTNPWAGMKGATLLRDRRNANATRGR